MSSEVLAQRGRRVATTFPACCGGIRHPFQQKLCQEEESTIGSGRDEASRTSLVLHSPMVVRLHPTRIPDNSGAAARRIRSGLAFTAIFDREGRASWLEALFPKHSLVASEATALCELAMNCPHWPRAVCSAVRRVSGLMSPALVTFSACSVVTEHCVGRPPVLVNCVGQGRLSTVGPLSGRFWRRSRL